MPDITLCTNDNCELSKSCWRFNAPPSEHMQSYSKFNPKVEEDKVVCDMYIYKLKPKDNE